MKIEILLSKIHNAVVTDCNLEYVGSITIDEDLMESVGILPNQKVMVVNNDNGERIETYVIKGERKTGTICLNGAAAHKFVKGNSVIIMAFGLLEYPGDGKLTFEPKVIFPEHNNLSYKRNSEICEGLFRELLFKNKEITVNDVDLISKLMGRDVDDVQKIATIVYSDFIKEKK